MLFLDEIGEMSPAVQAKLLRVLQEREFQRLGGTRTIRADIRVIAATNRNLKAAIAQTRSAKTCTTGWRSSTSHCRRCANGRTTSPNSRRRSLRNSARPSGGRR